jgi:hypothetical protein
VTPGKAGGCGAYPNDGAAGRRNRGSGQQRSLVGRELRWAATAGVGSCGTGAEGEDEISFNLGTAKLGLALTGEGEEESPIWL